MASAKAVEKVTTVTMELSWDEARFLTWLTGTRVVGEGPHRNTNTAIYRALSHAGVPVAADVRTDPDASYNRNRVALAAV